MKLTQMLCKPNALLVLILTSSEHKNILKICVIRYRYASLKPKKSETGQIEGRRTGTTKIKRYKIQIIHKTYIYT